MLGSGCSSLGLSTAVGPSRSDINSARHSDDVTGVHVVDLTNEMARSLDNARLRDSFADAIGNAQPVGTVVGTGDAIDITIWEAPPAALFSTSALDARAMSSAQVSRGSTFPEFLIGPSGHISVPFAGEIPAAGRTLSEIESDIVSHLRGKAHQPQVMVRLVRNATATVTVVGDVGGSVRLPLSPKGERLLDALAAAGGTRQPVGKTTIQITRDGVVRSMPLRDIIRDPRQNIVLKTDDVITVLFQPLSFTVLGAAGRNAEVDFEETGVTLAQAMGRIGGLQDMRADPKGVFIFRWEDPAYLKGTSSETPSGPHGKVPVIYRIDMKKPETYFAAQAFEMRDKDVVFITNSPMAEFQRFMGIISSTILPVATVNTILDKN